MTAILVFLIILSMCVSCAQTDVLNETTTDNEANLPENSDVSTVIDETTMYEPDDLAEKYDLNEVITFFIWSDHRMKEFYADDSGNNIDSAIYNRNLKVESRLGITIDFIEEKGSLDFYKDWNKKAENDFLSDNQYDIYAGYSRAVPLLAIP